MKRGVYFVEIERTWSAIETGIRIALFTAVPDEVFVSIFGRSAG